MVVMPLGGGREDAGVAAHTCTFRHSSPPGVCRCRSYFFDRPNDEVPESNPAAAAANAGGLQLGGSGRRSAVSKSFAGHIAGEQSGAKGQGPDAHLTLA